MKVNILGTKYEIQILNDEEFEQNKHIKLHCDCNNIQLNGLCLGLDKKIIVREQVGKSETNLILRHEIIHAFQFESGIEHSWKTGAWDCESETDWLAYQIDKIHKAFKELNIVN